MGGTDRVLVPKRRVCAGAARLPGRGRGEAARFARVGGLRGLYASAVTLHGSEPGHVAARDPPAVPGVARLLPQLVPVTFGLGDVLYDPDRPLAYLYFPTTAVVSLIYTMLDGTTVEMGLVGNEGVVGIALFMGGDTTPNRAIVQVAGEAFRLQAPVLRVEFQRGGAVQL